MYPLKTYSLQESEEAFLGYGEIIRSLRNQAYFPQLIRDEEINPRTTILERYFYDIYNLFLKSTASFVMGDAQADPERLKDLLNELIKVKALLHEQSDHEG